MPDLAGGNRVRVRQYPGSHDLTRGKGLLLEKTYQVSKR